MTENNNGKILMAFIAGAAIGAAIGYFLNSSKKDELVADLKEGASNLKQSIDDSLDKAKDIIDAFKHTENQHGTETQADA